MLCTTQCYVQHNAMYNVQCYVQCTMLCTMYNAMCNIRTTQGYRYSYKWHVPLTVMTDKSSDEANSKVHWMHMENG